jgi:hypothetical protein
MSMGFVRSWLLHHPAEVSDVIEAKKIVHLFKCLQDFACASIEDKAIIFITEGRSSRGKLGLKGIDLMDGLVHALA